MERASVLRTTREFGFKPTRGGSKYPSSHGPAKFGIARTLLGHIPTIEKGSKFSRRTARTLSRGRTTSRTATRTRTSGATRTRSSSKKCTTTTTSSTTTSTPTSFAMGRRQITTVIAGPALLATVRRIPLSAHAKRPRPRSAAADRRAATEIGATASSSYNTPDLDSAPFPFENNEFIHLDLGDYLLRGTDPAQMLRKPVLIF